MIELLRRDRLLVAANGLPRWLSKALLPCREPRVRARYTRSRPAFSGKLSIRRGAPWRD